MKKRIALITLFLFMGGCSKPIAEKNLIDKDGLKYKKNIEKPFNGKTVSKYDNGQKKEERTYKNGKIEGLYISWYEGGEKFEERNYKDGMEDGNWTSWYINGQKRKEQS